MNLQKLYPLFIQPLLLDIQIAEITGSDPEMAMLAAALADKAMQIDIVNTEELSGRPFGGRVTRNHDAPPEYTHPGVSGQPWADDADTPLEEGEKWNAGRRASHNQVQYRIDADGRPINPYHDYGAKGRIVGRFGPNHAVDMAPCRFMHDRNGQLSLHVLGIVRNDNGLPALCGGFTDFKRGEDGGYVNDDNAFFDAQTHEFFEELVSGSVMLTPAYATGLQGEINTALTIREHIEGKPVATAQQQVIAAQITTHRKLQQAHETDPGFFDRLHHRLTTAKTCYAGPVPASSRNSNNSWMETRLSWFMLDEARWDQLRGDAAYDFVAGDDAQDVLWHNVTPELIATAGNHGALFCCVLAACMVSPEADTPERRTALKNQAKALLDTPTVPAPKPAAPV